jgi:hypothetical protein
MEDLSKYTKKLRDFLESPEGKKSMSNFAKKIKREGERRNQAWEFLESLSEERFEELLEKMIVREEIFEEREYQKGKLKSSNVFNTVFNAILENSKEECDDDNMFFGGGSIYRGYEWKIFVGQGSFYTIEKGEARIFTSN